MHTHSVEIQSLDTLLDLPFYHRNALILCGINGINKKILRDFGPY